jgi:hypothetical protein
MERTIEVPPTIKRILEFWSILNRESGSGHLGASAQTTCCKPLHRIIVAGELNGDNDRGIVMLGPHDLYIVRGVVIA